MLIIGNSRYGGSKNILLTNQLNYSVSNVLPKERERI